MMPPELMAAALKMMGLLAIMIAGLLGLLWGVRRTGGSRWGQRPRLLRVIETCPLGFKKSLTMVQVPDGVLVLGISGDRIVRLDKLETPEGLGGTPAGGGSPPSFAAHLARLTQRGRGPEGAGEQPR
jgi:flagellar biogenesis protein FliO